MSLGPAVGRPGGVTKDSGGLSDSTVTVWGRLCLLPAPMWWSEHRECCHPRDGDTQVMVIQKGW